MQPLDNHQLSHIGAINNRLKAVELSQNALQFVEHFRRQKDPKDLLQAISLFEEAIPLVTNEHSDLHNILRCLASSYSEKYELEGDLSDLDQAIFFMDQACSPTLDGSEDQAGSLILSGEFYLHRYEKLRQNVDLIKALNRFTESSSPLLCSPRLRAKVLSRLGKCHHHHFVVTKSLKDLDDAIDHQKQAITLTPEGCEDKWIYLDSLGRYHGDRLHITNNLADANEAIFCHTQALSQISENHVDLFMVCNNLGSAYNARFTLTSDAKDLDQAIEYCSRSAAKVPSVHPYRATIDMNLGRLCLQKAFSTRFTNPSQIAQAKYHLQRALQTMPDHHSGIPELLNCLGTTAFYESHWARDPNCLDLAITYFAQSICLCTDVDEQKLMGLKRLGLIYAYRFDTSGNISDIDHAIEFNERALILAPNQSKLSVNLSSNLAEAYINRYKKLRDLLDLNRAASYLKQAVDWASNIEFQEPSLYFKLGSLYRFRYESTRLLQDFQSAVDAYKKAASMSEGNLRVRFQSASIWAAMSTQLAVDAPLEPYQLVMDLAFQMVQVGCTNNERFHQLILVNNIPYYGVQAAIRNREYDLALEWFESCRSTVWKRTLGFHSPTERLQEVNPELASRFKLVSSKFSEVAAFQPAFEDVFGQMVSLGRVEPTHRQLAEDWDNLIAEIRNIEGFEGFLKPYTVAELKRSAQSGPVVLLNTLVSGCDALILRVGLEEIGHVPLPLFSVREAAQLLKSPGPLLGKFRTDGCTKERRPVFESTGITNPLATLLCLLWTSVVKPIIGYLDYQPGTETEELPHITWCISGSIGLLPLHAAGIYDGSEPKSKAFNYMVSSYTPDLSTLLRERSTGSFQGVLMVGQTATRGQARLPGTVDELANIEKHVSGSLLTRLEGKDATPDAVLAAMRKHSWVHLACHASQKHHDFGASSFYLHNGDILDLSTIAREPPRHAEFAFLSACQTAQGDEAVTNEGIHLAGGMLIAGYSSVIASLWPINDKDAPLVADKVYERLFRSEVPDSKQAARALHYAVKCLREKIGEEKLDSWVPYIHMGPQ